jgi:hypothetical protein
MCPDVEASAALRMRSGRNDLGGEQTRRPEHKGMSAAPINAPRKVVFAGRSGKPTHTLLGKAEATEEETGERNL